MGAPYQHRNRCLLAILGLVAGVGVASAAADKAPDPIPTDLAPLLEGANVAEKLDAELHVEGMTFFGSRGDGTQIVLRARVGSFDPSTNMARLEDVHANGSDRDQGENFEVSCAETEFNVETNDFLAEGDVQGSTADGRRYFAPWVRYDHEKGLLYTDAPVMMQDDTGTFRGDGFRYFVKERRFRLVGNVRVVQSP